MQGEAIIGLPQCGFTTLSAAFQARVQPSCYAWISRCKQQSTAKRMTESPQTIEALLRAHAGGDAATVTRLFPLFYEDLRRLARRQLGGGRRRTLNTTALVHEAFVKFSGHAGLTVQSRAHFFALAAKAMRQVIVNHARQHMAKKRGGDMRHVSLDVEVISIDEEAGHLVELDEALVDLEKRDERLVRVVECRFFAGLTEPETAEALDVSVRTVQRDWLRARAWLRKALNG